METEETNLWGNDTNEGCRFEAGREMIRNTGEKTTCITNRMAKAKHSTWHKTWHKTKVKLKGHKMTNKPIKWTGVIS